MWYAAMAAPGWPSVPTDCVHGSGPPSHARSPAAAVGRQSAWFLGRGSYRPRGRKSGHGTGPIGQSRRNRPCRAPRPVAWRRSAGPGPPSACRSTHRQRHPGGRWHRRPESGGQPGQPSEPTPERPDDVRGQAHDGGSSHPDVSRSAVPQAVPTSPTEQPTAAPLRATFRRRPTPPARRTAVRGTDLDEDERPGFVGSSATMSSSSRPTRTLRATIVQPSATR